MRTLIAVLAIFLLGMNPASAMADEFPPPPDGYTWVNFSEIKGAFLIPHGWYFKKDRQGETQGYFITRENIEEKGAFQTGLSVNVLHDIPQRTGMAPSAFASAFVLTAAGDREVLKKPWSTRGGAFNGYGAVLIQRDPQKGDFITHHLVVANDLTGTLYFIRFECPTDDWETTWPIAEPILKHFLIDDKV